MKGNIPRNGGGRSALAVILAFGAAFALEAQELPAARTKADAAPVRLTVEQAVETALNGNIQLKSQAVDLRMKKRDASYAWNVLLPSIQATGTLARSNMDKVNVTTYELVGGSYIVPSSMEITLDEKDRWRAMAGLSATLNLNLALFDGLKATRQGYEAGKISWEQARQQTEQNVKKAFYGILVQEEALKLSRDKLAISEERLRQTETNYKSGLVPELSFLQAKLAVETQKPSIEESELNLDQQKAMFGFFIGLDPGTEIILDGEIEPEIQAFDAENLLRDHLADRLDLAALRKNIELLKTQYRATQLQLYTPNLTLSQSFSPALSAIDADWLDRDNWTDSSGAFSATLSFNLTNALPFSQAGQGLAKTKDSIAKLELTWKQAADNAEIEIRNLVRKLEKSRNSIAAMELNVSIADKAYRLSEQAYRAGTAEYLSLKDAENTLMQARLGVLSEKFTYLSTRLDLETALNAKLN